MVDANILKAELGERAKGIIAEGMGFNVNGKKNVLCPRHKDTNPSMSWFAEGLMWYCHGCEAKIDIYDYLQNEKGLTFLQAKDKVGAMVGHAATGPIRASNPTYMKPNIETRELSKPLVDYMRKRKITKETLEAWRVVEREWKEKKVYVFQYFNENNELEHVSYREPGKNGEKGGSEPQTKAILWGMWHIDKSKPVVITEGQPDAMAIWQAGYKNVVSVPSGSNNFKWIENCWDWLQGVTEIIVFADNDEPGLIMSNEIKRRLKNVKVVYSEKYKDANEVLYYEGPGEISRLINDTIRASPPGIIDLANKEYISAINSQTETIETGFYEYDSHVEDWKMQELTIIFGRNGEGKTTFISQIIAHCLDKNVITLLYSGEMSDQKIQDWLYRQLIGIKTEHFRGVETKYRTKFEPKPETLKKIKSWHKGKLYLIDRSEKEIISNMDKFFETMELAVKKNGVKLIVIDNLMAVLEENADSLYSDQANFVQKCKNFAINNNVHLVLLTHPNKEKREIEGSIEKGNLEKTDISGSNNIANKADNVIAVERNWSEEGFDAIVTSLKDRESGARNTMLFYFSKNSLRFYNGTTSQNKEYGWDKQPC